MTAHKLLTFLFCVCVCVCERACERSERVCVLCVTKKDNTDTQVTCNWFRRRLLFITFQFLSSAPLIGFDPTSYTFHEDAGEAVLMITTNDPSQFTNANGALYYTNDGSALGSGGMLNLHFKKT